MGKALPEHNEHGTVDDIRANMKPLKTSKWIMTAPGRLECDTDLGRLVQFISPDYICGGTDENGHPLLTRINL